MARSAHAKLAGDALEALSATAAVGRKESPGGTGPRSVERQMTALLEAAEVAASAAAALPSLDDLLVRLREANP
jgi:hypothetical protein